MNLLRLENPAEISPEVRYYSLERLTEEKSRIGKYLFLSCPDIPLSCCETYEPIVVVSRIMLVSHMRILRCELKSRSFACVVVIHRGCSQ